MNKNRILFFEQFDEKIIDVYEMQDISNATLFSSKEDALDTIKGLTSPSESKWEYSQYYAFDRIDIVDITMMYRVMDRNDWIEKERVEN